MSDSVARTERRLPSRRNMSAISPMRRRRARRHIADMIPLSDGLAARRFPIVNVSLIVANFAVWLFYELPGLREAVFHASFYPCTVNGSCHGPDRGASVGSRRCSCTEAGLTFSATWSSWPCSGRTSRRVRPPQVFGLLLRRRICRDHDADGDDVALRHCGRKSSAEPRRERRDCGRPRCLLRARTRPCEG